MFNKERKSLSKKTRFDVFKRDGFQCQYCDSTPPSVILEIDHIIPVSKGGMNTFDNLLTSCFECNRGKGASFIEIVPKSIEDKTAVLAEKMSQLKAYEKLQHAKRKSEEQNISIVEQVYTNYFNGYVFNNKFR